MTVTVKHAKTNAISDWTQAQLDEQIALGNFAPGTTLANIVLPSDWNNDHTLTGVGTMAEQNANNVAITGGTATLSSVTTPSVTATTNNLTLSAISTGVVRLQTANGIAFTARDNGTTIANYISSVGTSGVPYLVAEGSGTNVSTAFSSKGTGSVSLWTNNAAQVQFSATHTASAVNYVQVTGAATGAFPVMSAQGSDATVGLNLYAKGAARINFFNNNGSNRHVSIGGNGTAAVNYIDLNGTTTTNAPVFSVAGTDTNISMAFQPKGTGAIDLAAGSSGVNISNGGTVTAITRTAAGTGYTSLPTMTISAPTTAGGVQATATYTMGLAGVPTITSGGTGYTVGDTLTFVGGTGGVATLTVSTVSAGVITGVTVGSFGTYTALPTNPISVTGGTGSSATFTATWAINSGFTITNAGSGYIEQPTVTFSGGGGSGAAAFAIVGGVTTIKGIGSSSPGNVANSILFNTPSGTSFSIVDRAAVAVNYASAIGNVTTQPAIIRGLGSDTNVGLNLGTQGTGTITFSTNTTTSNIQMQVAHTASAVNYVQVTGAATGGSPTISTQGSDANAGLVVQSKGTSPLFLVTTGSTDVRIQPNNLRSLSVQSVGSAVNYGVWTNSATTFAPALSVAGTDTNIDLALTPKGTGLVRFGTYTAGALTATGYINIKAADGTTYKVLVST